MCGLRSLFSLIAVISSNTKSQYSEFQKINTHSRNKNDCRNEDEDAARNGLLPSNTLVLLKLRFLVFLLMALNFLIDDDLSLEAVLIPLLSLSLGALILLQLRLFFDRQCNNEDEEEDREEWDNIGGAVDWEDNGKNE